MPAVGVNDLSDVAVAAGDGDAGALEQLVAAVQDDVYRLAVRMLWHPEDAQDAAQEALVRIVTRVGSFRGEASFRTWAYRVAANCLLDWRQSRVERENLTFRRFGEQLAEGLAEAPAEESPDARLLAEEVKLGCTLGMLLCLDREQRLAYVLSDVLGLSGEDAAYVCGIAPAAFRQRASRARARLRAFVAEHCGLVNAETALPVRPAGWDGRPPRPHRSRPAPLRPRGAWPRRGGDGAPARPRFAHARPPGLPAAARRGQPGPCAPCVGPVQPSRHGFPDIVPRSVPRSGPTRGRGAPRWSAARRWPRWGDPQAGSAGGRPARPAPPR